MTHTQNTLHPERNEKQSEVVRDWSRRHAYVKRERHAYLKRERQTTYILTGGETYISKVR